MDATKAFVHARGAVWHLEVALPQLEAAAGATSHGDELVAAAAEHIRSGAADLALARESANSGTAALGDAALGAQLASAAATTPRDESGILVLTKLVRDARWQAQAGVDAITPHLTAPAQLLDLSPAAQAPHHELALVHDVAAARRFHRTSDVQRAQMRTILERGSIDPEPAGWVGGYGNGNGAMPIVRVQHPDTPHLEVLAVRRPPTAHAAQEEFFARLAEHAGTDHHYTQAVRRADGHALVPLVGGRALWDESVDTVDDIEAVMSHWYRQRFAGLDESQVRLAGRLDRESAQSLDFISAQPDRNTGGALADRSTSEFRFMDNGFAGRGEMPNVLKPGLKSHFLGLPVGRVENLHPDTRAQLAAGLNDEALADAHAVLSKPAGDLPEGHTFALGQDASAGYLEAMRARRDHLVATGGYEYEPIDLFANPLAHMDWLRSR